MDKPAVDTTPPDKPPATPTPKPAVANPVPATIGLIPPFDRLRPLMKQRDAVIALTEAKAKPATAPSKMFDYDGPVFETSIPGVLGGLQFTGGRLTEVVFATAIPDLLTAPVFARWGNGTKEDDGYFEDTYSWTAGPAWKAKLTVWGKRRNPRFEAGFPPKASLELVGVEQRSDAVELADPFARFAKLLGGTLAEAEKSLGPGLHREAADEDDDAAEAGARRQGYAVLKLPWTDRPFNLVIRVDASEKIREIYLSGWLAEGFDEIRTKLFASLVATFGAPRVGVSPAGRPEVTLGTATATVRVIEKENTLGILIQRR